MLSFKKIADIDSKRSLAHSMRSRRFGYFLSLIAKLNRPVTILDIGGTQEYWINMGIDSKDYKIIILNLLEQKTFSPDFCSVVGDATDLHEYRDKSFDVVYSNSVIEHLFTKENQRKMASEATRVGKYHFIQTPNYYFPVEPHFLFPGFQFLPKPVRYSLVNKFNLGHIPRQKSMDDARLTVDEIRLLTIKEMKELFPQSVIWKEKFGGVLKSIVAHNLS